MRRRICDKFGLNSSTSAAKRISKRFNSAFTEQPSKKQKKESSQSARRFDLKKIEIAHCTWSSAVVLESGCALRHTCA